MVEHLEFAEAKFDHGWTQLTEPAFHAWKAAGHRVAHIDTLDDLAAVLLSDVKQDRVRSSRGTFM